MINDMDFLFVHLYDHMLLMVQFCMLIFDILGVFLHFDVCVVGVCFLILNRYVYYENGYNSYARCLNELVFGFLMVMLLLLLLLLVRCQILLGFHLVVPPVVLVG